MDRADRIISEVYTARPKLRAIKSSGAKVTLSDGKQYIDLLNGKGSVTLGHHHPAVNSAIIQHLNDCKTSTTCWSHLHEALSSRIISDVGIPDAKLAFFSSGTEACRAAVQVARKATRRHVIASAGYHGWGDLWDSSSNLLELNSNGVVDFYFVPELLERILERFRGNVALIILSPDYVHLRSETLRRLALIARNEGVLLCCDDVKQGYRSIRASRFPSIVGFQADMYTFAKGLANGHRLSCLIGRSDLLAEARDFTYTAYFDTVPFVAALATLDYMDAHNGYQRLAQYGATIAAEMRNILQRSELPIIVLGDGPLLQFVGATASLDQAFYENCALEGLLLYEGDNQAISLATGGVLEELLVCFEKGVKATFNKLPQHGNNLISRRRRFQAAFRMIDGANDMVSLEEAIAWIREER